MLIFVCLFFLNIKSGQFITYHIFFLQFYQSFKQLLRKEPQGVNSTCETYTLAVSKCMSQNNTPEKQKMTVAIVSKVEETIQENDELLESNATNMTPNDVNNYCNNEN